MVKFILHGGGYLVPSPSNELFFRSFTTSVNKDSVKVLICCWAKAKEKWQKTFERDTELIKKYSEKKVEFDLLEDSSDLEEKTKKNDVFFVVGGEAENLEAYYPKFKNLKSLLENKVYIGSSMGAFMVVGNYVLSLDYQDISKTRKGLSLLHLNVLCHWNIETKKDLKINMLIKKAPNLPILTLNEGEFASFVI